MTRLFDRLARAFDVMLACVILAMVALACLNAALRYVFGYSILWADEILVFAMIAITFLGVISVTARSDHLKMSLFVQSLNPTAARVIRILENAVISGVCLFVASYSWKVVALLVKRGTLSNMSNTPLWILHALVLIGLLGIALVSAVKMVQALRSGEGSA